jgi:hypothetical protein
VVTINNETEEAIKFVKVTAEGDGCTVGFLPRCWFNLPKVQDNIHKFCIIRELYAESPNQCERRKSKNNKGMAGVILRSTIPIGEWFVVAA